jgi:hypothetical protein
MNRVADASLWNIEASVNATPLSVVAPVFVEDLVRLAAANEGEFDGWGTSTWFAAQQIVGRERRGRVS